jgi:K+-transporting ATPase ATPase C chain
MMGDAKKILRGTIGLLLVMTVLLGGIYPMIVMGIAQLMFPHKANGSLVEWGGKVVGSELIGQRFDNEWYFWSRPSATTPPYNAAASGGSNLSPSNPKMIQAVKEHISKLQRVDTHNTAHIPMDLVTASASGLDPHISLESASYQLSRVAKARSMKQEDVKKLIEAATIRGFAFGMLGQDYVNVLELNMSLDELAKKTPH